MRKICIICVLIMICFGFNTEIVVGQEPKGPVMIIPEDRYDFGTVKEGAVLEHTFRILNRGTQDLEIKKIMTGCECAKVSNENRVVIPPGGEYSFVLTVNTEGYAGDIEQSATIYTNDPKHKVGRVAITASIDVSISVTPKSIYFGGYVGRTIARMVTIRARRSEPLSLKPVEFTLAGKVEYALELMEQGQCFRITFKNQVMTDEGYEGILRLQTNYPDKPDITIPIMKIAGQKEGKN